MRYLLSFVLLFTACSGPEATNTDAGVDLGTDPPDAAQPVDAKSSSPDSTQVPQDVASTDEGVTTAPDTGSDSSSDASIEPDQMPDTFAGRPVGQCTADADCPVGPNGQSCSRLLPGGACLGCGDDTHCPGDATCSQFGACISECVGDDDCPPGLECGATGRCGAMDCAADSSCPVDLFGCNANGRCERVDCAADPSACPSQTTCVSGVCIEDRALNP